MLFHLRVPAAVAGNPGAQRAAAMAVRGVAAMLRPKDGLHPEMAAILRLLPFAPGLQVDDVPLDECRIEVDRTATLLGGPPLPMSRVQQITIPAPPGNIPARLYRPRHQDPARLLVWYHGGGWSMGSLTSAESICRFLAYHSGVPVLSVAYRLAPEHRFPAACDDAVAAYRYAVSQAAVWGHDPVLVAVGGDSGGATLATTVCHDLLAAGERQPCCQFLLYPATDLAHESLSYELGGSFFPTPARLRSFIQTYLSNADQAHDRRASPLLATDFKGLAPAYIALAQFDILRDEGLAYAQRLQEAGVPVKLHIHEGLVHAFANVLGVSRAARAAVLQACQALREVS